MAAAVNEAETQEDAVRGIEAVGVIVVLRWRRIDDDRRRRDHRLLLAGHDLPGTVRLPAGGSVALLLSAADDDGGDEFPAGLPLGAGKGPDRDHCSGGFIVRVHPLGGVVGLVTLQSVLKRVEHRLLLGTGEYSVILSEGACRAAQRYHQRGQHHHHPSHDLPPRKGLPVIAIDRTVQSIIVSV